MPEFFDYDPLSGLTYYFEDVPDTDDALLHAVQDVEPLLDRNKEMARLGATDHGIKEGMFHYASIPPVVQIIFRQKGLDIYSRDPTMMRKVKAEIEQNYPYLKVTEKRIWIPKSSQKQPTS